MWIREYDNPDCHIKDDYFKNNTISVLFIGGIHGNEVNTIMAIGARSKMPIPCDHIDPHIKKVGFIPCANFDAFRGNVRGTTKDLSDLNRGWVETDYRKELKEIMNGYDVIIDCHCSENISPLFYLSTYQPATDVCASIRHFEREQINYALSCNTNDTIKLAHTHRLTYHPQTGYYRKQLSLTWEENGMSYQQSSVESTEQMIDDMLKYYAYTMYRDALIQELIDTPPVSTFNTLGFILSAREGVFKCDFKSGGRYKYPIICCDKGESINIGWIREFDRGGRYDCENLACANYLKYTVDIRVLEIMNGGIYVNEGTPLAMFQPSNAGKFPHDDIHNAATTYIPDELKDATIMSLHSKIVEERGGNYGYH